jgi:hypothetical protein
VPRDIDAIDWSKLSHAYGNATDVPLLLQQARSSNPAEREAAFQELHPRIAHQGSVYEATAFALPFLIEMLRSPERRPSDEPAFLVATIIGAENHAKAHYSREFINPFTRKPTPRPSDYKERIAQEEALLEELRRIGKAAAPDLLPLLEHEHPFFRATAARALRHYVRSVGVVAPALQRALANEPDDEARKALERALKGTGSPEQPG